MAHITQVIIEITLFSIIHITLLFQPVKPQHLTHCGPKLLISVKRMNLVVILNMTLQVQHLATVWQHAASMHDQR